MRKQFYYTKPLVIGALEGALAGIKAVQEYLPGSGSVSISEIKSDKAQKKRLSEISQLLNEIIEKLGRVLEIIKTQLKVTEFDDPD